MKVFTDSKTVGVFPYDLMKRCLLSATVTLVVALFIAVISACSVYKSNGRNTFESQAGTSVVKTTVGRSEKPKQEFAAETAADTCWTQPLREPLWDLPENEELRVHALNSELIEVCLVSDN